MVYGFVQQSGGMIEVDSEPGDGTEFRLLLPVAAARGVEATPARRCIPCVEDNTDARTLPVALMMTIGQAVLAADRGTEGPTILAQPVTVGNAGSARWRGSVW